MSEAFDDSSPYRGGGLRAKAGRTVRVSFVAALAVAYAACQQPGDHGKEICKEARAHLEECELAEGLPAEMECTEREECTAACVTEATCSELKSPKPDGPYVECLVDCEKKAEAGTRPCEEALERLEFCEIDTSGIVVQGCAGQDLCVAKCINDATCSEVRGEEPEGQYVDCVGEC